MGYSYVPSIIGSTNGNSTVGVIRPWDSISQVDAPSYGSVKRARTTTAGYTAVGSMTKTRKKKLRWKKTFKQRVMDIPPAKHNSGESLTVVGNNDLYSMNFTGRITQGDGIGNRDGDGVFLEAVKIRGHFQAANIGGAYKCRIIVGYSSMQNNNAVLNTPGIGTSMFFPATWYANGIINPKNFTSLYDTTLDVNSIVDDNSTIQSFAATVPLKMRINYELNGGAYGKGKNLYMVVIPYGVGVVSSGAVGSVYVNWDVIFKNF